MAAVNATGSGNWSDPTKWSCNPSLPGAGDDVTLGAYAMVLNQDATVLSLTWTTGSLTVSGNRTLTTAVTIPSNTGYVSIPASNTLNLVGNMTYVGTGDVGGPTAGAFRVSGILNQTGKVLVRIRGFVITVDNGGVYNLTGNVETTSTVTSNGQTWIVGNPGSSITMVGDIYAAWNLNYGLYNVIQSAGTFTFTGSISFGTNTVTNYYQGGPLGFTGSAVATINLNGLTMLTALGSYPYLIYATGSSVVTVNAVPLTLVWSGVTDLAVTNNSARLTWNGDITMTLTMSQDIFYCNGGTLIHNGNATITSAAGVGLYTVGSGSLTATGTVSLTSNTTGTAYAIQNIGGTAVYNGNIAQTGSGSCWAVLARGVGSTTTVNGNVTCSGSGGTSYIAAAESNGQVVITGTATTANSGGTFRGLYAATGGGVTLNGTLKRTVSAVGEYSVTAHLVVYQIGTGTITINGSIEILAGDINFFYYADLTKITWTPGASGHFTYLNWSFGGNDYPAIANVLSPTSYGFGAFTGTAQNVSGQMAAALAAYDVATTTQVNTRLAAGSYIAPDNASIAAIKEKTDNLPNDPASETTVNTRLAASDYGGVTNQDKTDIIDGVKTALDDDMKTILGLVHQNFKFFNQVYDSDGNLESGTVEIYDTANDLITGSTPPRKTYNIVATYVGKKLVNYQMILS